MALCLFWCKTRWYRWDGLGTRDTCEFKKSDVFIWKSNTVLMMCPSYKKIWSQWFHTALCHQLLKIYFPGCFEKSCQRDALASYCEGAATWPLLPTTQLDCFTALEPASGFWPEISCAKNTISFLMIESIFARVMQMQMLSFLPCHLPGKCEDTWGKPLWKVRIYLSFAQIPFE